MYTLDVDSVDGILTLLLLREYMLRHAQTPNPLTFPAIPHFPVCLLRPTPSVVIQSFASDFALVFVCVRLCLRRWLSLRQFYRTPKLEPLTIFPGQIRARQN